MIISGLGSLTDRDVQLQTYLVRHSSKQLQAHLCGHIDNWFPDVWRELRLISQDSQESSLIFVEFLFSLPVTEWLVTDLERTALLDHSVDSIT